MQVSRFCRFLPPVGSGTTLLYFVFDEIPAFHITFIRFAGAVPVAKAGGLCLC